MTQTQRLRIALALTAALAALEIYGGLRSGSLSLLSDAAHVAMDVLAIGLALAAGIQAQRPATPRQSFGFARTEVIAALVNGGLLLAVTAYLAIAAFQRFLTPQLPSGEVMSVVALIGLATNLLIGFSLMRGSHVGHSHGVHGGHADGAHTHGDHPVHPHAGHSHHAQVDDDLNMRAVLWHVFGDAASALAVAIGGVLILFFRLAWIDPLLSLVVSAIIVIGIIRIVREASDVLLESAPEHADVHTVGAHLRSAEGVLDVHDVHVWTIGRADHVLSAHVILADSRISEATKIRHSLETSLRDSFAIAHVTLQLECRSSEIQGEGTICSQRCEEAM